jgi:hypothetical protein
MKGRMKRTHRNLLPVSLDVVDLGRNTKVTLRSDLMSDTSNLRSESSEL